VSRIAWSSGASIGAVASFGISLVLNIFAFLCIWGYEDSRKLVTIGKDIKSMKGGNVHGKKIASYLAADRTSR
jgi:hypothetical protein